MLFIIADDLTGATDTGVQLSKKGYDTNLFLNHINNSNNSSFVKVIDSETRELSPVEAKKKLRKILKNINFSSEDIIYKKIDSTLRGNIMLEIKETMNITERDLCIFTPAFPDNNRLVLGGYLLIENLLLGESDYNNEDLEPSEISYIPDYLRMNSEISIDLIDIKEVVKGPENLKLQIKKLKKDQKQVIIFDAINNKHLANIIKGSQEIKSPILYAGSAGLANHLTKLDTLKTSTDNFIIEKNASPFLMVIGSRRNIIDEQINYLKEKLEIEEVKIDIIKILQNKEENFSVYINKVINCLNENKHVILRPLVNNNLIDLEFEEKKKEVKNILGNITSNIIKIMDVKNLLLSGGDTAIGVCQSIGINKLKILQEILPGIPLSKAIDNKLNVITKAGGFGDQKTLYKIIMKLNNGGER